MMQATPTLTPTLSSLPLRGGDFGSLAQALDYAAQGETGYNFYNGRGKLYGSLTYAELRREARSLARRLLSLGLGSGARVALVAETGPDFMRFFFACQYARLVPVPLPVSINLGSQKAYVEQLRGLLQVSQASAAMAPSGSLSYLLDAAEGLNLALVGDAPAYEALAQSTQPLPVSQPDDLAYLQFTSGSTRFPRGVMITQRTVLANLAGIIRHGVEIHRGDRCVSWLPFYHDMGLVGLVLVPMASQMSVDYLDTRDFAMRPRQWLALISQNRATISFGPPFGYELCARRLRPGEANRFDLSSWRVAGVGAEMIRTGALEKFAQRLAPAGFDSAAFLPCYGMAECSLGVSFSPLNQGLAVDRVDADHHSREQYALPIADTAGSDGGRVNTYVNCGVPLPDYEVEIRDGQGRTLADRHCGTIFLRGASVMSGYLGDPGATAAVLDKDGWLDTGDIGYRVGASLFITGRQKDLIIINGRNVWPQDLEHIAEQQPEVRTGDVLAFSAPGADGEETTVLVVQCRETDQRKCNELTQRLRRLVREELGIESRVELVPLHTLPRTSSGKLSRSRARLNFIAAQDAARSAVEDLAPPCHHQVA